MPCSNMEQRDHEIRNAKKIASYFFLMMKQTEAVVAGGGVGWMGGGKGLEHFLGFFYYLIAGYVKICTDAQYLELQ